MLNFLDEFNICEFDVAFKGKTTSFRSNIWQAVLIQECINNNN